MLNIVTNIDCNYCVYLGLMCKMTDKIIYFTIAGKNEQAEFSAEDSTEDVRGKSLLAEGVGESVGEGAGDVVGDGYGDGVCNSKHGPLAVDVCSNLENRST